MSDVKVFWEYIGSAWQNFEQKAKIETFWGALESGITRVLNETLTVQSSRYLPHMASSYNSGPYQLYIVWSGQAADLTITPLASGGLFEYDIEDWTYSIPAITYEYVYNGATVTGTYSENTHYRIVNNHHLVWNMAPPAVDPRFPGTGTLLGYAKDVYRINPLLMNTWARFCDFSLTDYVRYGSYGANYYKHLKMLIWALVYKQMQAPTIKTLRDGFGISRGLPFAYESGIMSSTYVTNHYELSLSGDTYILPSGMYPISSGSVNKFDVLCSGLSLWDYTTNPGIINQYSNTFNRRNTLVYQVSSSLAGATYASGFFNDYMERITPSQLQYFVI